MRRLYRVWLPALLAAPGPWSVHQAHGQDRDSTGAAAEATRIPEVTVIGTHSDLAEMREQINGVAGGAALIGPERIRSTRQANLHDVLRLTPGVYVQPRFGAADESQLSIRGSGLRNNFHLRGVNLLVNGMPYRNADGFTDFESLELLTTEAIEVYKGANALRYGGATLGGAVNLTTKTGYTAGWLEVFGQGGSYGFLKAQAASGGSRGGFDYYASYARTELDGYRAWSDQGRHRVNVHAGYRVSPQVDLRAFYFFAQVREHLPGALTPEQFDANPRGAVAANVTNRWGRGYDLHHVGLQWRSQLSPNQRVQISPYFQYRDIDHPIFRVISQRSRDVGAEVRYESTAPLGRRGNRLTVGYQPSHLRMDDRQFDNVGGEHGALRKDQKNRVTGHAVYAENALSVTGRLTLIVGFRFDRSVREAQDFFLADGDQSDRRSFSALMPRAGVLYDVGGDIRLFANASRAYEPPLLLELNSLTVPGFINLRGQDAWQLEIGTRGQHGHASWDLSLYDVELADEILNLNLLPFPGAPFTVSTYRNAERTRHYGVEAGLGLTFPATVFTRRKGGDALALRVAYTFAKYAFVRDSGFGGNDIPGAPPHYLAAELRYAHPGGVVVTPMLEWVPQGYYVNSANTERNGAWAALGLRAEWTAARAGLTVFAEGRNLTDTRYAASVQVDNAARQYLEPADGRSLYAGLRVTR
jgi:iron complex outermembrane recepter protein